MLKSDQMHSKYYENPTPSTPNFIDQSNAGQPQSENNTTAEWNHVVALKQSEYHME